MHKPTLTAHVRWILKTPFHLLHMDQLLESFPTARIVWTHREPSQCVPSFASLIHTLRAASSDRVDAHEVGRQWSELFARAIERSLDAREADEDSTMSGLLFSRLVEAGDRVGQTLTSLSGRLRRS